jgi:hypothetical protein
MFYCRGRLASLQADERQFAPGGGMLWETGENGVNRLRGPLWILTDSMCLRQDQLSPDMSGHRMQDLFCLLDCRSRRFQKQKGCVP